MNLPRWLAALLCAAALIMLPTHLAHARPDDGFGPAGHRIPTPRGTAEMGQYHLGSTVVYCIDLNSRGPRNASGWVSSIAAKVPKQVGYGGTQGDPRALRGPVITDRAWAEIAWLLDHSRNKKDSDWVAAMDHVIRTRTAGGRAQHDRVAERYAATVRARPAVARHVATMERLMTERSGPYRLEVMWVTKPGLEERGIARIRVLAASGQPIQAPVKVQVNGRGVTPQYAGGEYRVQVPAGAGKHTVEVRAHVPASRPLLYRARHHANPNHIDGRVQRMTGMAPRAELTGAITTTVALRQPKVSTTTSAAEIEAGAELSDVVTLTGIDPGTQQATAILYGPYDEPPTAQHCRADEEHGRVTFAVSGATSTAVTTPSLKPTEPGHYTWVIELGRTPTQQAHRTACGIASETTLVTEPPPEPSAEPSPEPEPPAPSPEATPTPQPTPAPEATPTPNPVPSPHPTGPAAMASAPEQPEASRRLRIRAGGLPPMITGQIVAVGAGIVFAGALAGEIRHRRRR
ncbi:hypothetical protein [Enemella sp. A6]|uniref:hypothetical protein n=1 Tax=Enemella sp. A6 TaxID=3440152 RepID=UPI003EBC52A2